MSNEIEDFNDDLSDDLDLDSEVDEKEQLRLILEAEQQQREKDLENNYEVLRVDRKKKRVRTVVESSSDEDEDDWNHEAQLVEEELDEQEQQDRELLNGVELKSEDVNINLDDLQQNSVNINMDAPELKHSEKLARNKKLRLRKITRVSISLGQLESRRASKLGGPNAEWVKMVAHLKPAFPNASERNPDPSLKPHIYIHISLYLHQTPITRIKKC